MLRSSQPLMCQRRDAFEFWKWTFHSGDPVKRDIRPAALLLVVICISLALLTAWQIWSARQRTLQDINTDNRNLVQALDTYSEGVIKQCELLLLGLVERVETEGHGPDQLKRLRELTDRQQHLLSQLNSILLFDAKGDWLLSSNGPIPPHANSADRAFFIHHRDNPSRAIFIGPPIRSRSNGQWVITVSRRINDDNGNFAGVAVVTLDIDNFLSLFGRLDVGRFGAMSLTNTNGQMLVRYPLREQDIGRDLSDSPIFTQYLKQANEGSASMVSRLDGVERLYAFRRNDQFPLVITVALGLDEALSTWRRGAELFAGVVLALLVTIGVIGQRLILDIQGRIRTKQQLLAAREDLLKANERLEVLASQDPLTGLANRRCFDERLSSEFRRASREGTPLSLLLIDIDYFKRYNDTYGHVAGDECLKAVSRLLRDCAKRPGDLAVRYGGEELALILPNTDASGARAVAGLFLESLNQCGLAHNASPFGIVTASLGSASVSGYGAPGGELALIDAADRALYQAKEAGRNQLRSAAPEDV